MLVHQQNFTTNLITELLDCLYFLVFFPCLAIYPIRFSACANLVSNSIQTTTLFIICTQDFEDDVDQVRVQISELSTE